MIVTYKLADKLKPTVRQVHIMSRNAEARGHTITHAMMRAMDNGDLKFVEGKWYKLCSHCLDYHELDKFYNNKRYVMGVATICKTCRLRMIRIRKYGQVDLVSDTAFKYDIGNPVFNVSPNTSKILEEHKQCPYTRKKR